jgi:hypothetical protein
MARVGDRVVEIFDELFGVDQVANAAILISMACVRFLEWSYICLEHGGFLPNRSSIAQLLDAFGAADGSGRDATLEADFAGELMVTRH